MIRDGTTSVGTSKISTEDPGRAAASDLACWESVIVPIRAKLAGQSVDTQYSDDETLTSRCSHIASRESKAVKGSPKRISHNWGGCFGCKPNNIGALCAKTVPATTRLRMSNTKTAKHINAATAITAGMVEEPIARPVFVPPFVDNRVSFVVCLRKFYQRLSGEEIVSMHEFQLYLGYEGALVPLVVTKYHRRTGE